MQSLLPASEDFPAVLREHFIPWADGQWSIPGTLHLPADRNRIYSIAADLRAEYGFNFWVRIDIEPWVEPEEQAEQAMFVHPQNKHHYRVSDLQPLDLVLIGNIWHRIARVHKRSITVCWGEHRQTVHPAVPQDVREVRRPHLRHREHLMMRQSGTTLGQLRALLTEQPSCGELPVALRLRPDGSLAYPLATTVRMGHFAIEEADAAPVIGHLSDDAADGLPAIGLGIEHEVAEGPATTTTDLLAALSGLDDQLLVTVPRNGHHGSQLVTPLCRAADVARWSPHGLLGHGTLNPTSAGDAGVLALQPIW
ncbi:hypothetical protein [Nonomuraea jabiensis]|uniref:hypothetical protein n=1 Tax=Nonomuraea jabiensis TaxID=882448 RepID=UPI003D713A1E